MIYNYSKVLCIAIFCTLASVTSFSQPLIQWEKSFGGSNDESIVDMIRTSDDYYISVVNSTSYNGHIVGHHGYMDLWVVKTDNNGAIIWKKNYGGTNYDYGNCVIETDDNGYIIVGYSGSNDGDVSGNHGAFDGWIIKIDSSGTLLWQRCLGGTKDDMFYSIGKTGSNGYIVAGVTSSDNGDVFFNHGYSDVWVVQIDSVGNILWEKTYGGSSSDWSEYIRKTFDNGYILAGNTYSNDGDVSSNHGISDYWIVKIDSVGNLLWQNTYGGSYLDQAYQIEEIRIGEYNYQYLISGISTSADGDVPENRGSYDIWLLMIDTTGNKVWSKVYGGSELDDDGLFIRKNNYEFIMSARTGSSDGDVTMNYGDMDVWLISFDNNGNINWEKTYGGSNFDGASSLQITSDGQYMLAGTSFSNNNDVTVNYGNGDFWLVKLGQTAAADNIETSIRDNIKVYPNPTKNHLFLAQPAHILLNSVDGKCLLDQKNSDVINVSVLPNGTYILNILDENDRLIQTTTIIKE